MTAWSAGELSGCEKLAFWRNSVVFWDEEAREWGSVDVEDDMKDYEGAMATQTQTHVKFQILGLMQVTWPLVLPCQSSMEKTIEMAFRVSTRATRRILTSSLGSSIPRNLSCPQSIVISNNVAVGLTGKRFLTSRRESLGLANRLFQSF